MSAGPQYDALVAKVDAFGAAVGERRASDLACRRGCDACCRVELTVSPVEAAAIRAHLRTLPPAERDAIAERTRGPRPEARGPVCPMLDDRGACSIYPARPLVCRTQGLPLLYPPDVVPAEAVRARTDRGEVTWCPLNFTERAPAGEDVLDAERVDEMLALVNRAFVGDTGDPHERIPLGALASEASER